MSEVKKLEQHLAEQKTLKDRADAVNRLYSNRDFKKIILEGFCRDEAARFIAQSTDPAMPEEARKDALFMAKAPGGLLRFLSVVKLMGGEVAERNIRDAEAELELARAEEDAA